MQIHIFSDLICPWCLIGRHRLDAALKQVPEIEAQIVWQPFQLNPDMPAEGMDRHEYISRKFGAERARQVYRRIEETAAAEGLTIDFSRMKRTPNTLDAHRAVLFAAGEGQADALTAELFQRHFVRGEDISRHETLADAGKAVGLDPEALAAYLASGKDRALIQQVDGDARRAGIDGVPFFILGNRLALMGAQEPEVMAEALREAAREATAA